jgi:hypothetical protein
MKTLIVFFKVFVIVLITIAVIGCCGTKKLICTDGNPVMVQRCPQKQYEQFVKATSVNVKAGIDILDKLKISGLDVTTTSQVTLLRETLNNFSSRFQDILKASFSSFSTAPCDKDIRTAHTKLLENLTKENSSIESLRLHLEALSAQKSASRDTSKINSIIKDYKSKSKIDEIK